MSPRRRTRVTLVVVVVLSLVLITVDVRGGGAAGSGPLASVRDGAAVVLGPIQDGLARVVRPVADAFNNVTGVFDLSRENRELQARVQELRAADRQLVELEAENEELRGLLDMAERFEADRVAARAIDAGANNFDWTILIDVGAEDGIEPRMPVINDDGLVGRVLTVHRNTARVLLTIDPNFGAAVRVDRSRERGQLQGQGGDPLRLRPEDPESDVEVGDVVVTSAFQGGIFPAGIPVGEVVSVDEATVQLQREVGVRPYVDFTRLDHVVVLQHQGAVIPDEDELPGGGAPDVGDPFEDDDEDEDAEEDEGADEVPGTAPDTGPSALGPSTFGRTARSRSRRP